MLKRIIHIQKSDIQSFIHIQRKKESGCSDITDDNPVKSRKKNFRPTMRDCESGVSIDQQPSEKS